MSISDQYPTIGQDQTLQKISLWLKLLL